MIRLFKFFVKKSKTKKETNVPKYIHEMSI